MQRSRVRQGQVQRLQEHGSQRRGLRGCSDSSVGCELRRLLVGDDDPQRSDYELEDDDYYKEEDDKFYLFSVHQRVDFN